MQGSKEGICKEELLKRNQSTTLKSYSSVGSYNAYYYTMHTTMRCMQGRGVGGSLFTTLLKFKSWTLQSQAYLWGKREIHKRWICIEISWKIISLEEVEIEVRRAILHGPCWWQPLSRYAHYMDEGWPTKNNIWVLLFEHSNPTYLKSSFLQYLAFWPMKLRMWLLLELI